MGEVMMFRNSPVAQVVGGGLVSFDNNDTDLNSGNIQDAIKEVNTKVDIIPTLSDILLSVYPVGSIYMSVNNVNPSTIFGGTWIAWGEGQVPVGVKSSDTDFDTVEKTGGAKSVTLTSAQSGVPAHSHGLNSHKHSVGAHSHGLNSHKHSVGAHSHGLNSHKHSVGAHSHGLNSHTHSFSASSTTESSVAYDTSNIYTSGGSTNLVAINWGGSYVGGDQRYTDRTAHTHKFSVSGTTGGASGSTANSTAFDTGAASGSTANSTAFDTGAATGSTANSTAFDTGAASGNTANKTAADASAAQTNLQPYITCYMWKRTA